MIDWLRPLHAIWEADWKHILKHMKRVLLVILHCILFGVIGFFCSQYSYLEKNQQKEPYIDSLMRAGEVVKEKGLNMKIEIQKPERKK